MWPRTPEDLAADPPRAHGLSGLPENLYALYMYARNGNRWGLLGRHWEAIRRIGDGIRPDTAGELAGLIACARIARHLGHPKEAQEFAGKAATALESAKDWVAFTTPAGGMVQRGDHSIRFPGLYNMTPEVGRFLEAYARGPIEEALRPATSNPLWYLTKEHGGFGENHLLGPDFTWAIFQTEAYVFHRPGLDRLVDLPWVELGDLYYLQKLVALLQSSGLMVWVKQ